MLENQSVTTEREQFKKTSALLKKSSKKWMIRWSWVETHTGVFGSQVANSLAKKNTQMSSMNQQFLRVSQTKVSRTT